jgi:ribosomal protein S18 acetylase RimI-like enzyme
MKLHLASANDAPALAAMASIIWPEAFSDMISGAQIGYMLEHIQSAPAMRRQITEGTRYWFIEAHARRIGYAAMRHAADERVSHLSKLYILAEARGGATGEQALSLLCDDARAAGSERLSLTVNKYNARAIRFYEKHGFTKTREIVLDIGGGFIMDDYVMDKTLQTENGE